MWKGTEYGDLLRKSPYSVPIRQNTDQKNPRIWTLFMQYYLFIKSCSSSKNCWYSTIFEVSMFLSVLQSCNIPGKHFLIQIQQQRHRQKLEICSKLIIKTPKWPLWRCPSVFMVNFGHISHLLLCFYCCIWTGKCLLTKELTCSTWNNLYQFYNIYPIWFIWSHMNTFKGNMVIFDGIRQYKLSI